MGIAFPAIDPVAFAIGPLEFRWYALAYLVAFLAGWRLALYLAGLDRPAATNAATSAAAGAEKEGAPRRFLSKEAIDDFLPWAILGVILGGRLGYVLFYQFDYYAAAPFEALKVWRGGMAFHGGAMGVIIAMIVYSLWGKWPLLRLTDIVCCVVPLGLFLGRLANFVNGELYGRVTDVPWGVVFPFGGDLPRHPSQIYQALMEGLALFGVMMGLAHCSKIRNMPGILSGVFLIGYGLARVTGEMFREPDAHLGFLWGGITMGQALSVPMILFGAGLIVYACRAARHTPPQGTA